MQRIFLAVALVLGGIAAAATANAAGDTEAGARAFSACAACHSLEPGRHMTGPSLAHLWGRKAGTAEGFARYSPALKSADIVWNDATLDAWLADPKALVSGNTMIFPGIKDAKARVGLIGFLKAGGASGSAGQTAQGGMMGGGMGRGPQMQNLKTLAPAQQVVAIRYCGDTYLVTTAVGELPPFWEFNLRFKTDSSATGPAKGHPAIMGAGMMGDRASVIFADPAEIGTFIEKRC
ncbi:MAG: cytochrome C [Rhodospirillales bacterium RIFCSPLOWO2_12_FULL_67_15]|nr:MAG: cytochrome C [Rhodospirillales bacterium RIFCSPLOWO2_12_FULL_67_15]